jgi:Mg-chelatase subunit ChlD
MMRVLYPIALGALILIPLAVAALFLGRRHTGIRRIIPLALRVLALVLLTMVAAGFQTANSSPGIDVVFVVDVSDSLGPESADQADSFVRRALAAQQEDDRAAIVLVGDGAAVERSLQTGVQELSRESVLSTSESSLAEGVIRAVSLFEDARERRIVLVSDGQQTRGDVVNAARIAADAGIRLWSVPLSTRQGEGEVFIRSVTVPREVRVDQTHEFGVVVAASDQRPATVTVFRDGQYYGEDRVLLGPGDNVIRFQGVFEDEGIHRYNVTVSSPGDPVAINNEYEALVRVIGEPTVLYVATEPAEPVLQALASQGILVESIVTEQMPSSVGGLATYDAVILDNVPAYDMSLPRMEALERYVRDTGGGLLMLGGDASFGAGGYYQTPIERTMPVDMDITSTMRIPSLSMVFVIDKSGSMGAIEVSGESKLDLVKEAVVSAVEIMNPFYTVGLIAFDADWEWTVPITRAGERAAIIEDLARLESGGGTVLEGALEEALRALSEEEAAVKHLVVLSDGLTDEVDLEPIIEQLRGRSITVSTVSVGSSANRELMQEIAEFGGGRSYHASDSRSVPRIFAAETTIVSRDLIVEETFIPQVETRGPILEGITQSEIPPLEGFVLAYQKDGAQLLLSGTQDNPVLSAWQYGLGRSVSFTSDLRAKWGINWLDWPGYPQLLAQSVRWAQRPPGSGSYVVRFDTNGNESSVLIDAFEPDGAFRNLLDLRALVQPPVGEPFEIPLEQTAPGRYEESFRTTADGSYLVTVYGDAENAPRTYGLTVPFTQEYLQFQTNFELLSRVAQAGNGAMLPLEGADTIFDTDIAGTIFSDTIWKAFLIAAVALLIMELLLKKIILPVGTVATTGLRLARTEGEHRPTGAPGSTRRERSREKANQPMPSYQEVRRQVAETYQQKAKETSGSNWYQGGDHNPVAERKIYIARKRKE